MSQSLTVGDLRNFCRTVEIKRFFFLTNPGFSGFVSFNFDVLSMGETSMYLEMEAHFHYT